MSMTLSEDGSDGDGIESVNWARPVRQDTIRRLYETDARGIVDEGLIDDAGCALYLRCRSIVTVTEAAWGRVACPRCATVIPRTAKNNVTGDSERLLCGGCGWHTTWGRYRQTYQGQQLFGAGGYEAFQTFLARFDEARTAREKLHAIDRLIHAFHYNLTAGAKIPTPSRPAAANVIEGTLAEVVGFLDRLSHGERTTPEMRATRAAYEERMPQTWAGRRYRIGRGAEADTPR